MYGTTHDSGVVADPSSDAAATVRELETKRREIDALKQRAGTCRAHQKTFALREDDFSNLAMTDAACVAKTETWRTLAELEASVAGWFDGPIKEIAFEDVADALERVDAAALRMGKANRDDRVVFRITDTASAFKTTSPILQELSNRALRDRHWEKIFALVGKEYADHAAASSFSLRWLLGLGLDADANAHEVSKISAVANKEHALEKALRKMRDDWDGVAFKVFPYKDTGTHVVGGVDDVQQLLDDHLVKTASMRASSFIKPFELVASSWEETLKTLQEMLDNWLSCQSAWQYLEPIFSSEDIMKQMPEEGSKFNTVDQIFREIQDATAAKPHALDIAKDKQRLDDLAEANTLLDAIQKGLAAYLEVKRVAFPRFFFLSNDEMLEILSETKDPTRVQPHLQKCFEGIHEVEFKSRGGGGGGGAGGDDLLRDGAAASSVDGLEIVGMCSVEGERVEFVTNVRPAAAGAQVEKWLVRLEHGKLDAHSDRVGDAVARASCARRLRRALDARVRGRASKGGRGGERRGGGVRG
jgi:dynein heavy chain